MLTNSEDSDTPNPPDYNFTRTSKCEVEPPGVAQKSPHQHNNRSV
jgi:hypothetical protein